MDDDDDACLSDDNCSQNEFLTDDNSVSSQGSAVGATTTDSFSGNVFADSTELPVASDYSCFTTSQKCVTSLMYLLDEMECPDYGFQSIMEWARKCFELALISIPNPKPVPEI